MSMKQIGKGVLNPGTKDETWGLCDDLDLGQEADKENVKDGNGDTVGLIYTDARKKVSGNYTPLVAGGTASPACKDDLIGSQITINLHGTNNTITVTVDDASMKYKRGSVPTFSFSGYYYPNITFTGGTGSN